LARRELMAHTTRLGDLVLIRRIGIGGMGEVFLARPEGGGGEVVVKVLSPHLAGDAAAVDLLANEARLAEVLVHPNVVRVHGFKHDQGGPYLVMEYVPGLSLARALGLSGALELSAH